MWGLAWFWWLIFAFIWFMFIHFTFALAAGTGRSPFLWVILAVFLPLIAIIICSYFRLAPEPTESIPGTSGEEARHLARVTGLSCYGRMSAGCDLRAMLRTGPTHGRTRVFLSSSRPSAADRRVVRHEP